MKYWVFDLDGTLVDSFSHFFLALEEIFSDHGARFSDDLRTPALTEPLPLFFEAHLGAAAVEPALLKLQELSNNDASRIQPFAGVTTILRQLREEGAKIAIWTNRDHTSASLILEETGLSTLIDLWISGTCTSQRKPHPEGLLRIIRHFGCSPAEVTMVGDHEHDVLAAKAAGARAVRASWHAYWPDESCPHSNFQFHKMADFERWMFEGSEASASIART